MSDNHLAVQPAGARSPVADHVAYIRDRSVVPCSFAMYDNKDTAAFAVSAEVKGQSAPSQDK